MDSQGRLPWEVAVESLKLALQCRWGGKQCRQSCSGSDGGVLLMCPRINRVASVTAATWESSSVQLLSCFRIFATPWITARQASLSITNSLSLLRLMSIESVMPSSHLILCRPLLLLPSIRVFSNESALHTQWPKYWSFSFSISPFNEHPGLISFRMDWLDLLAEIQGALKSLLQHHSSKAWILQCSAFFMVQLSHPYMTSGKTIALTRWTFVGKVMFLLFNMLCRFVITFLPRSSSVQFSFSVVSDSLWPHGL